MTGPTPPGAAICRLRPGVVPVLTAVDLSQGARSTPAGFTHDRTPLVSRSRPRAGRLSDDLPRWRSPQGDRHLATRGGDTPYGRVPSNSRAGTTVTGNGRSAAWGSSPTTCATWTYAPSRSSNTVSAPGAVGSSSQYDGTPIRS